jgi:hypothetical protein
MVYQLGEVAYSRQKFAEAMAFVRTHPGNFLRLLAERIAAWWFPPHPPILLAPKLVLTLLAFAGLWRMFRRQPLIAWLFLITWLTFPDVYYLVHWSSRYRSPILGVSGAVCRLAGDSFPQGSTAGRSGGRVSGGRRAGRYGTGSPATFPQTIEPDSERETLAASGFRLWHRPSATGLYTRISEALGCAGACSCGSSSWHS